MARRLTDTNKWKKPFVRGLQGAYKLLWFYICDDCDHAGIWQVEWEIAEIRIGDKIDHDKAIELFGGHIQVFDGGTKWFIPSFIEFQYGQDLNPKNRVHESVIKILSKNNLEYKGLVSPLQGAKDKDMDKGMDKDKDKDIAENSFSDEWFAEIFDDILMESFKSTFPDRDLVEDMKVFKLKVRGSPDDYRHRDSGGIRQAFLYQLRNSRNGTNQRRGKRNQGTAIGADAVFGPQDCGEL